MAAYLPQFFDIQFLADAGAIAASYVLYTYEDGTTTPKATYTDATGATPNANPVALNSAGRCALWLGSGKYSFELKTGVGGTLVKRYDGVDSTSSIAATIMADLIDNDEAAKGAGLVADTPDLAYASGTVGDSLNRLRWGEVSIFQFLSSAQIADVRAGTLGIAINSAVATAVAHVRATNWKRGKIKFPRGKYRFDDEVDIYTASSNRQDLIFEGDDQLSTIFVGNFYGASKAMIKGRDTLKVSRCSPVSFRKIGWEHVGSAGINPMYIDILGWGESRLDENRFGSTNNTVIRGISAQNVRGSDIVSFYGGRHFNYKNTSGLLFDVNSGTRVITCTNGTPFTAADTGRYFFIFPSNADRRIRYQITYLTSSTASFTEDGLTETGAAGHFEPARASMTSGSAVLTANASVFSSDMVGMVLCVERAKAGSYGDAFLRSRIVTYTSPTQVTLEDNCTLTCNEAQFGVPAFDFGTEYSYAGSSDVIFDKLHIEHYRGIGFLAMNTDSYRISGKIHGETTPTDSVKSTAAIWMDDFGGEWNVSLDSSCSMGKSRVHWCNSNDAAYMSTLITRGIIHGEVFSTNVVTDNSGYLFVNDFNSYVDFADPYDMVDDRNWAADATDPRVLLTGNVNMVGDSQTSRFYTGRGTYFTPDGQLVISKQAADAAIASTITWNGTPPSGSSTLRYRWKNIGGVVSFQFRLEYAVAGASNSTLSINLPADMPAPQAMSGAGSGEFVGACVVGWISTAPNVAPALCKSWMIESGGSWQFAVSTNSGTIAATFAVISGFYVTDDNP